MNEEDKKIKEIIVFMEIDYQDYKRRLLEVIGEQALDEDCK